jgi:putative peptidoglycan lipid II flippase
MHRDDYRATVLVMIGLGAAALTGYLRQATIAYHLGAGRTADLYLVAFAVPEFIFVALPIVLSPAFVPLFARSRQQDGEAAAWHFGVRMAAALFALLALFTLLGLLAAPLFVSWLAPGFNSQERVETVQVARVMLPAVSLMGLATLVGAALQVYRRFFRPALSLAIYNLVFVGVLSLLPWGEPLDRVGWGVTAGAAAALLFQLPLLWRHRPAGTGDTMATSSTLQVARLAGPFAAGYAVHHLILFVDRAMATTLGAGDAAALNFAYHLALVVGQISGLAVSTALFPLLAEQIAAGDKSGARSSLGDALRLVWLLGLPATCGLIILRTPLVGLLFERGAFDAAATSTVSDPLRWYGVAILADALCQPLWRVIYARRTAWTVLGVNSLQTGIRLLGNVAFTPLSGYNGIALSAALGLTVQVLVLGWLVRRHLGEFLTASWWRDAMRVSLAAALASGVFVLTTVRLPRALPMVTLLVGGASGALVYLATLRLLRYSRRISV